MKQLYKLIPSKWKIYIKYFIEKKVKLEVTKDQPKIIVVFAADYGNLGDVAITSAQIKFLETVFPNHSIIPLYTKELYRMLVPVKKVLNPQDIITLIGGGNMGDIYEGFEENRRKIIQFFPGNKIVSFPQTIDFSKGTKGVNSLKKTVNIYSKHRNLHLVARESISYNTMKDNFKKNKIYMVPDIVLSLNKSEPTFKREGIILSLRNDSEKNLSNEQKKLLIKLIEDRYTDIKYMDTHIGDNNFSKDLAEKELNKIWNGFKSAKVVITDRLHGMIFCAITKTPCIVLPNSNHKISCTYNDWLFDLNYIKFIEKYDDEVILNSIQELYNYDAKFDKGFNVTNKYNALIEALKI